MNKGTVVCHISFNHDALDDRIYWKELCTLQQAGCQCVHVAVGKTTADFVTAQGIRVISIKRKAMKGPSWLNRVRQYLFPRGTTMHAILHKAKELNAAVYHYHDLQLNAICVKLKKLPWKPRVIYDAHEAYHFQMLENAPRNPVLRALYQVYVQRVKAWELKAAGYCDWIFATDPYTFSFFRKAVPQVPASLLFNYSFFQPESISFTKEYDLIYTGLLNRGRGLYEMAASIALLKPRFPKIRLLLIGPFQDEKEADAFALRLEQLQIREHVVLHPPVPFSGIQDFYRKSRIGLGLFHDTPKYRSFIPIKLFEYMAFGLPVVFANQGPAAEIIADADCGLLVQPREVTAAAQAIEQLLTDETLYLRKSANGKQAVASKYNWEKEKEKLLEVYEKLLEE